MSAAIAGHARIASSDTTQASPRFALPLKDEAADLEESALLKVLAQLQSWLSQLLGTGLDGYLLLRQQVCALCPGD